MSEYQVTLHGKHFGIFEAESPTNAITRAKLSSPLFRTEPYAHFKAEAISRCSTGTEHLLRTSRPSAKHEALLSASGTNRGLVQ